MDQTLLKLSLNGDVKGVGDLLTRGLSPDLVTSDGSTVLLSTCKHLSKLLHEGNSGELKIIKDIKLVIKLMLERGGKVDYCDPQGRTPFHVCCACGDLDLVKLCVHSFRNVNLFDKFGNSVLHAAIKQVFDNRDDIVDYLIEQGADVTAVNLSGQTTLHAAAIRNCSKTISLLLQANRLMVNVQNKEGNTALHELIIKHGKLIPFNQHMHHCLECLLKAGTNVLITNKKGESAFHLAAEFGDPVVWSKLVKFNNGKSDSRQENNELNTPLHVAVSRVACCFQNRKRQDTLKALKELVYEIISSGPHHNVENKKGDNPLGSFLNGLYFVDVEIKFQKDIYIILLLGGCMLLDLSEASSEGMKTYDLSGLLTNKEVMILQEFVHVTFRKVPAVYPTLQEKCAKIIRKTLWPNLFYGVRQLTIPPRIKDIILPVG